MNRYTEAYRDTLAEIEHLEGRYARFIAHPTLFTRAPGVLVAIDKLKANLSNLRGTSKLVDEMFPTTERSAK